jgi:hypothetical protein
MTTLSPPASAAVVIDQDAIVPPLVPVGPQAGRLAVTVGTAGRTISGRGIQTITAGTSGILNAIEVQGPFSTGLNAALTTLRFSLWDGDAFAGGADLLGFQDLPLSSFPNGALLNTQLTSIFDVSSFNYSVAPGKLFSIAVEAFGPPDGAGLFIVGNVPGLDANNHPIFQPNQYAGGTLYFSVNNQPYSPINGDLGFRTYVEQSDASSVPEPAAWAMMIFGFGLVGGAMRYRRGRVALRFV